MPSDVAQEKHQVHQLIDRLAPSQLTAVRGLLEAMLDPVAGAVGAAQPDDEPVSEDDRRRIREGEAWLKEHAGKGIPMDEILAEFGVSAETFTPQK